MKDEKWEINRLSTPDRILHKIAYEMGRPVGIVVFGADDALNNQVAEERVRPEVGRTFRYEQKQILDSSSEDELQVALTAQMNIMLVLDAAKEAVDIGARLDAVKWLRRIGMKTVVAIYVEVMKRPVNPLMSSMEKVQLNQRIAQIEQSRPKELCWLVDYFITVPEEVSKHD